MSVCEVYAALFSVGTRCGGGGGRPRVVAAASLRPFSFGCGRVPLESVDRHGSSLAVYSSRFLLSSDSSYGRKEKRGIGDADLSLKSTDTPSTELLVRAENPDFPLPHLLRICGALEPVTNKRVRNAPPYGRFELIVTYRGPPQ